MPVTRSINLALEHRGFSDPLLSLRGIAALAVLVFHSMLSFKIGGADPSYFRFPNGSGSMLADQLVVFMTNGGAAVTFFFVHSGFVLSLSLDKSNKSLEGRADALTASFYVKRLFRLYPVIIVAALVGLAVVACFSDSPISPVTSSWYHGFFPSATVSLERALISALSINPEYNQFAWSLRVEFLISIGMPLLYYAMRKRLTAIAFIATLPLLGAVGVADFTGGYIHAFFGSYLLCFVIGFSIGKIPKYFDVSSTLRHKGRLCDSIALLSFIVMLVARPALGNRHEQLAVIFEAVASVPIIYGTYYLAQGRFYAFCNHAWVRYLGSISYSMYMLSSASIYVAVRVVVAALNNEVIKSNGLLANVASTSLAIVIAILLSSQCFKYVEVPLMNLGKRLGDYVGCKLSRKSAKVVDAAES